LSIKNHSNMFRIVCDPSSGSTELCLTEITHSGSQIFFACLHKCTRLYWYGFCRAMSSGIMKGHLNSWQLCQL